MKLEIKIVVAVAACCTHLNGLLETVDSCCKKLRQTAKQVLEQILKIMLKQMMVI